MKKLVIDSKGQVLMFVALGFVLMGLFAGLAVDGGRAFVLKAQLSKMADAASLAGARVIDQGISAAEDAACDSARANSGTIKGNAGTCPDGVEVETVTIANTNPPQTGVKVTAVQPLNTSFVRLGLLVGCGAACETFNISASATAAPASSIVDVVLVLDDTGSMKEPTSNPKIKNAKEGATAIADMLLGSGGGAKLGLVPFRGCYDPPNKHSKCIQGTNLVNVTDQQTTLLNGINKLVADGGSGTNVCMALNQGDKTLFGAGSRPDAKKVLVLLTDADSNMTVAVPEVPECNAPLSNHRNLDKKTLDKATAIKDKNPPPDDIEIFVIDYGTGANSSLPCVPLTVGVVKNDHNLAKCLASPDTSYPHYLPAPTPDAIKQQLIFVGNLLLQLRLTN